MTPEQGKPRVMDKVVFCTCAVIALWLLVGYAEPQPKPEVEPKTCTLKLTDQFGRSHTVSGTAQ